MKVTNTIENDSNEVLVVGSADRYNDVTIIIFNKDGNTVGQITVGGNSVIKAVTNAMNN